MLDKIAKLLAKAEATNNTDEADAYNEKAEKLMLKHGIEQAQVDAARGNLNADDIVIVKVESRGDYFHAHTFLATCLADGMGLGVKVFGSSLHTASGNVNGAMVWLVGFPQDIELVQTLWHSLWAQALLRHKAWWRDQYEYGLVKDSVMFRIKREYLMSFGTGASTKLKEVRLRTVDEAVAGTELVLVSRAEKVDNWIGDNLKYRKNRRLRGGTEEARQAGRQAGHEAATGKVLENSSAKTNPSRRS